MALLVALVVAVLLLSFWRQVLMLIALLLLALMILGIHAAMSSGSTASLSAEHAPASGISEHS